MANSVSAAECSCDNILLSCNTNYIWIQSTNAGKTPNNVSSNNLFCDNPTSNPSRDCIVSQIDDAITRCYGYSNCRLETDFYPVNCYPSGSAYLCIQYSCVPSEKLSIYFYSLLEPLLLEHSYTYIIVISKTTNNYSDQ